MIIVTTPISLQQNDMIVAIASLIARLVIFTVSLNITRDPIATISMWLNLISFNQEATWSIPIAFVSIETCSISAVLNFFIKE